MAKFKVGQKVRVVSAGNPEFRWLVGMEAVLVRRCNVHARHWDLSTPPLPGHRPFSIHERDLSPLTDPGAEKFIESIRKMKPYEEPTRLTYGDVKRVLKTFG